MRTAASSGLAGWRQSLKATTILTEGPLSEGAVDCHAHTPAVAPYETWAISLQQVKPPSRNACASKGYVAVMISEPNLGDLILRDGGQGNWMETLREERFVLRWGIARAPQIKRWH